MHEAMDPAALTVALRRLFTRNPIIERFSIEVVSVTPGAAVLRFPYQAEFTQYQGAVQGGVISAYADAAIAVAMSTIVPDDRDFVTTDLHVWFLRPLRSGPILVRADVVHRGNSLVLGSAVVEIEGGEICARAMATNMLVSPRTK